MYVGVLPDVANGEPVIGVSAPVEVIANADMLLPYQLVTYTNFPDGSIATKSGPLPVANGEPVICVSAPVEASME